jgi:hypothetical protein
MSRRVALSIALLLAAPQALAQAQKPQDMGTPQQRAACGPDVGRYCKSVKAEEGPFAYLACLQQNRDKLRPACVRVIEGGAPLK